MQVEAGRFSNGIVLANLALAAVDAKTAVYSLDLYARTLEGLPGTVDEMLAWHELAHQQVVEAFLFSITDEARRRFKERS